MPPPCSDHYGEEQDLTEGTLSPGSDSSTPLLGHHAQALIACNQKLQDLGIRNTIKLPQVCVIGDQSTGKSSLIEAISTIKVPKAKGCCTTCPLAINLSSGKDASSPWTCTITIEEHYDLDQSIPTKGVTKANPFGPWQLREAMRSIEIGTTCNKDEVSDLILAAQKVVLNPGTQIQDYLGQNARKKYVSPMAEFSPNIIRIDVSEGNWPNLSFIDLPGVIANTTKKADKFLVKLIKNLVEKYAAADRSINMLTLPMTHDVENSSACAIIQDLGVEAQTLAVFTKADLADEDQRDQFLKKFTGSDTLGFQHGYHFVVMPDGLEQKEARQIEADLFAQDPWSALDRQHRARLGIEHLTVQLRCLLFQKTAMTLPKNLESIKNRIKQVTEELATIPAPPNGVLLPLALQTSVTRFENAMKGLFFGDLADPSVKARTAWSQKVEDLAAALSAAVPTVYVLTNAESSRLRKAKAKNQSRLSGTADCSDAIDISSDGEARAPPILKVERSKPDLVQRFHLDDIRTINERYYQSGVPGLCEPRAIEEMNRLSVQYWDKFLREFMDDGKMLLHEQVSTVLQNEFGHYSHLDVFKIIEQSVVGFLDSLIKGERGYLEDVCAMEQAYPMTRNKSALKDKETQHLTVRQEKRDEKRRELYQEEAELLTNGAKRKAKRDDGNLERDPFEIELLMSAKNKAYYEVASARFVDNVSHGIFGRLLPSCSGKLADDLKKHLGLDDPSKHDQIIRWMTEKTDREEKRRRLVEEQARLEAGLSYINSVLGLEGSLASSPSKRRLSGTGQAELELKTPTKRSKVNHVDVLDGSPLVSTDRRLRTRLESMELDDKNIC